MLPAAPGSRLRRPCLPASAPRAMAISRGVRRPLLLLLLFGEDRGRGRGSGPRAASGNGARGRPCRPGLPFLPLHFGPGRSLRPPRLGLRRTRSRARTQGVRKRLSQAARTRVPVRVCLEFPAPPGAPAAVTSRGLSRKYGPGRAEREARRHLPLPHPPPRGERAWERLVTQVLSHC